MAFCYVRSNVATQIFNTQVMFSWTLDIVKSNPFYNYEDYKCIMDIYKEGTWDG